MLAIGGSEAAAVALIPRRRVGLLLPHISRLSEEAAPRRACPTQELWPQAVVHCVVRVWGSVLDDRSCINARFYMSASNDYIHMTARETRCSAVVTTDLRAKPSVTFNYFQGHHNSQADVSPTA